MKYLSIIIALMLVGCSTYDYDAHNRDKVERLANEARQRDNNPTKYAYNQASIHGCNSAKADGGILGYRNEKNVDSYVKDEYYRTGYDDGYKKCKAESDRIDDAFQSSAPYRW